MKPVHGIGICNLDHLIVVPPSARGGGHVLDYCEEGGGLTATAIVAAARLGAPVKFWSRVGDDERGRKILDGLAREGVDTRQVQVVPGARSPVSVVQIDSETRDRTIYHFREDIFERPTPPPPPLDDLEAAGALLVDHCWPGFALEGARRARELGIPIVGDVNPKRAPELAAALDFLIVGEQVAREVAGGSEPESAIGILHGIGPKFVAVTMGERGCLYSFAGEAVKRCPSVRVEVVDTTGAGDAFHGAFAYALAQGWPVDRAVSLACAVGAMCCTALGGRAGLPDFQTAVSAAARCPSN